MPIDFLIPTFNERANLPYALQSVIGWADNVFVLDSCSTDGTQEIARQMGATVVEHPWEGYARQKNWGLDNLPFRSPWIFILDADEAITPELREELTKLCNQPVESIPIAGYYVNRYLIFMGKRIRHSGYFPSWNLRLFKRGAARYEDRPVHEHMILHGREAYLHGLMSHEDRRGLEYYIAKHNRYSTLEAQAITAEKKMARGIRASPFGNAIERRRFFKNRVYPKLPGKWFGRFFWMYFIRLGILDGPVGLRFCLLIASYELFTSLKLRELEEAQYREDLRRGRGEVISKSSGDGERPAAGVEIALPPMEQRPPAPIPEASLPVPIESLRRRRKRTMSPRTSPWSMQENFKRVCWMLVRAFLFRPSFHNWYGYRRFLLRTFGAKIGTDVRVRPSARIEIPWNLEIGDGTLVGDYAILYSLGRIPIGRHVVISQYAHLCAGTHDHTTRSFPLLRLPIRVDDDVWIAADAFVGPNVTVGTRAVVAARATVVKDVPADAIVAGTPAKFVKPRVLHD